MSVPLISDAYDIYIVYVIKHIVAYVLYVCVSVLKCILYKFSILFIPLHKCLA